METITNTIAQPAVQMSFDMSVQNETEDSQKTIQLELPNEDSQVTTPIEEHTMKFTLVDTATYGETTDDPFFQSPTTEHYIVVDPTVLSFEPLELQQETDVLKKFKELFQCTPISHIYSKVLPSASTELKYDWWTLFSIDELVRRSAEYDGRFYDVGTMYVGMGHVMVLCYEPLTQMFFFHVDGGGNGYERYDNHKKYTYDVYEPANFLCINPLMHSTCKCDVLFHFSKLKNCLEANSNMC